VFPNSIWEQVIESQCSKMISEKPKLAAIDIGTNSFHLIIVEVDKETGKFKILTREKDIVRLGTGSTDMKYLSSEAIDRGITVLKRFKGLSDAANANIRAIATSAVREAKNQSEFIIKAKEETGINVEVASGIEEARFIYLGILQALPVYNKMILLVDIGGGSTEFLVGQQKEIFYDNSIKLGAIRLTEKYFRNGITENKDIKNCRKYLKGMMNPVTRELLKMNYDIAVGSSGTIINIANMINLKKGGSTETRLNNFSFTKDELYDIVEDILDARTEKQRLKIPGLDPQRADIITAGALILEQIFREAKLKEMIVSEYALREGIIFDSVENLLTAKEKDHLDDIRYKSIMQLAENYHYEKEHSLHVAELSLKIFDSTNSLHKLGYKVREYLEAAAILHESGCFVSHSQHHRHSYYLIRNSELLGFTENEKEIIANVARYHRKSHPKDKHPDFAKLNEEDKSVVRNLSSILRIADGLDRTHKKAVNNISIISNDSIIKIILKPNNNADLELELWGAENKKGLFEETFGVNVEFEVLK
jgi:exopolyphosphatase / guanosine-5'-triphosphate,3'-diphosphate pyrophosphatase